MSLRLNFFMLLAFCAPTLSHAQTNTVNYRSTGYFNGLDFSDSLLIKADMVITIAQNKVEFLKVDLEDSSKDELFYTGRCLSPIKYPTTDGDHYMVWKLGDRKMVLMKINGIKYISLYQTNDFSLPKEYLTFKIKL
jgi:hypothetical protein